MTFKHQLGEIIQDRYCITGILGKGGVAITYSAKDLKTDKAIAIKVISLKQLDDWKQIAKNREVWRSKKKFNLSSIFLTPAEKKWLEAEIEQYRSIKN